MGGEEERQSPVRAQLEHLKEWQSLTLLPGEGGAILRRHLHLPLGPRPPRTDRQGTEERAHRQQPRLRGQGICLRRFVSTRISFTLFAQAQFEGGFSDASTGCVPIEDTQPKYMRGLLQFIFTRYSLAAVLSARTWWLLCLYLTLNRGGGQMEKQNAPIVDKDLEQTFFLGLGLGVLEGLIAKDAS